MAEIFGEVDTKNSQTSYVVNLRILESGGQGPLTNSLEVN